jgi:GH24 family phage-related lysozyme (muramidase)
MHQDKGSMTQASMTVSAQVEPSSRYTLRVTIDTWLKVSTAQGSSLPEDQKQFLRAGTLLPVDNIQRVENGHARITFGEDKIGQKIHIRGRSTWYVYQPAVQVLRNGATVPWDQFPIATAPPANNTPTPVYQLRTTEDTWLKLSTAQGSSLPDDQRQFVRANTVLSISSFARVENDHLRVAFGLDAEGNQVQFQGRNTWYIYRPVAQILRNGQVVNLGASPTPPAPTPPPTPAPVPTPPPASTPPPAPTAAPLTLRATEDTWLKLSTAQAASLPTNQKQSLANGTVLPVSSYALSENNHIRIALGVNNQGTQLQFQGRNTWFVYRPTVQLLQGGQVINLGSPGRRQINAKGLRLLKSFEGLRLQAYLDPVGIWTIGYGTTTGVRPGMRITEAEAEALLQRDLARFEQAVSQLITVPLNEDQYSALVSFTYNVGEGALSSSTLRRLLNQRDYLGAADQLLRWNRGDGGRELVGLTRRRRAERALFLGQDYTVFL